MPTGTYHNPDKRHLHIVCTDPDDKGRIVLVPVSTWTNDLCDSTCILLKHEHPWLWKPKSYVYYRKADFFETVAIERGLASGDLEEQARCNDQVFLRVLNGLCNSPNTPKKIKRAIGC